MQTKWKKGRGGIRPPSDVPPWFHVPGWRAQTICLDHFPVRARFTWNDFWIFDIHCFGWLVVMDQYDPHGALRPAWNKEYDGKFRCTDIPWWDVLWVSGVGNCFTSSAYCFLRCIWQTVFPGYCGSGCSRGKNWNSVAIPFSLCRACKAMAPKRSAPQQSRTASGRPCTRELSREQGKAAHSAKHYKSSVPLEIQADIAKAEQEVWEEANRGIPEQEFNELAEWIHDPGKTYGRIGLYQRSISYFWAAKCLIAKLLVEQKQQGKEGKELRAGIPVPLWDHHYNDARLMHRKLDVIASKLGIRFVAPEVALAAKATVRDGEGQSSQPALAQVP